MRRRCPQCGEVRAMLRRQGVCSLACETARRRATGVYARMRSAQHRKPTVPETLEGFGPLTAREQGIYMRARENALSYARDKARRLHAAWLRGARVA